MHIQSKTLSLEDTSLLSIQYELARVYLSVEENEKAIALLEIVVEIEVRTLRPEHLDRLAL